MITVHHLENSRSQRVLWLLEELGLDYEIKRYDRDPKTSLAPAELMKVHPLGKSPVLEDDGVVYAETGAIIEHLVETHGGGRLRPAPGTEAARRYRYWLHAAEGSYMPAMVLALFVGRIESAPMPFFAKPIAKRIAQGIRDGYLDHTVKALFQYAEAELARDGWFAGPEFTAADIMMSFPIETGRSRIDTARASSEIGAFLARIAERPAYQRALERGGPYVYAAA